MIWHYFILLFFSIVRWYLSLLLPFMINGNKFYMRLVDVMNGIILKKKIDVLEKRNILIVFYMELSGLIMCLFVCIILPFVL